MDTLLIGLGLSPGHKNGDRVKESYQSATLPGRWINPKRTQDRRVAREMNFSGAYWKTVCGFPEYRRSQFSAAWQSWRSEHKRVFSIPNFTFGIRTGINEFWKVILERREKSWEEYFWKTLWGHLQKIKACSVKLLEFELKLWVC